MLDENNFKTIINKSIDILCINGECYVNIIEEKEEAERTWYDKLYLWYHQNFTIIILVLGCLLFASMIYFVWSNKTNKTITTNKSNTQVQSGGFLDYDVVDTSLPGGGIKSGISSAGRKAKSGIRSASKKVKSGITSAPGKGLGYAAKGAKQFDKMGDSLLDKGGISSEKLKEKGRKVKEGIKAAPGKIKEGIKAVPGKLKQGAVVVGRAAKQHAKSFYMILFSIGIVLGFAFFFMPTICMIVIGYLTFQLTKNQVVSLFTA